MVDVFDKGTRSRIMQSIRSKNTKPEIAMRKLLFSLGFRYVLHKKGLPGSPDIVLPKYRTVVFVNGCFWHGHTCKIGSGTRPPKSNEKYWSEKISRNIERDRAASSRLAELGWNLITVWECETRSNEDMMARLAPLLRLKR